MSPRTASAVILRSQSDQRLAAFAGAGSERAFEALVRRHRPELVVHCRRLLLSESSAEDAVQQTLLAAWQALRAGEEVQHPRAWLHRIAHRRALDARKRSGYDYAELQESLRGGELPQDELERRTVVRETLSGLAGLPELQRDVLLRTAVHGDSYETVASDLALPESTIRGMLARARGTLRAAATAITPGPLVAWAAAAQPAAPAAHGLAEGVGLGGSAGLAGLAAKLAAVSVVAGGVVGGVAHQRAEHRAHAAAVPAHSARTPPAVPGGAQAGAPALAPTAAPLALRAMPGPAPAGGGTPTRHGRSGPSDGSRGPESGGHGDRRHPEHGARPPAGAGTGEHGAALGPGGPGGRGDDAGGGRGGGGDHSGPGKAGRAPGGEDADIDLTAGAGDGHATVGGDRSGRQGSSGGGDDGAPSSGDGASGDGGDVAVAVPSAPVVPLLADPTSSEGGGGGSGGGPAARDEPIAIPVPAPADADADAGSGSGGSTSGGDRHGGDGP
jgi:RNA polymerase sigma factor (sigma-70 family)